MRRKIWIGLLLLVSGLIPLFAWEGKVFEVSGKKVTIASSQTSGVRAGTRLYILKDGKEVGQGRVGNVFHTKVEMTLTGGVAEKGLVVTDKNPTKEKIAEKKDEKSPWKIANLPTVANWRHLVHGNGVFVAAEGSGFQTAVSVDGTNWTPGRLPYSTSWVSLGFGNGVFVAIAGGNFDSKFKNNIAATSSDGINWTAQTLPKTANWKAVAYGNGVFVLISTLDDDKVLVSSDGKNWDTASLPRDDDWGPLVFGNSTFVAFGHNSNKVAISADGKKWQEYKVSSGTRKGLTYGNNLFLYFDTGSGTSRSADGIAWTAGQGLPTKKGGVHTCGFGNGMFVVAMDEENTVAITSDGLSWTTQPLPAKGKWNDVVYGNGIFAILEYGSSEGIGVKPSNRVAVWQTEAQK